MTSHHAVSVNHSCCRVFVPKEETVLSGGLSFCRVTVLTVVLGRLHLEDVRNDAVNGDVSY